jgi:hypothetical protein
VGANINGTVYWDTRLRDAAKKAATFVVLPLSRTVEHSARKTNPSGPAELEYAATQIALKISNTAGTPR